MSKRVATRSTIAVAEDPAKALVKAVALDIGKQIVAYIEVMYPEAITATSSTFKLSVRNSIYNEIMAAIQVRSYGANATGQRNLWVLAI